MLCWRFYHTKHTFKQMCCVGCKTCCTGGLTFTTHFQYILCVSHLSTIVVFNSLPQCKISNICKNAGLHVYAILSGTLVWIFHN